MDFKEFLQEAINVPPHLPGKWWRETLQKAETLESQFAGLGDIIKQANKYEKEYGEDNKFIRDLWEDVPYALRNKIINKDTYEPLLSDRIKDLQRVVKIPNISNDVVRYNRNAVNVHPSWDDTRNNSKRVVRFMKRYSEVFLKEKYFDQLYEILYYNDIDDIETVIEVIKKAEAGLKAVYQYLRLTQEVNKAIPAFQERDAIRGTEYYGKKIPPKHANVETLFHVTPFMNEVLTQGFKTKDQLGGLEVLGGATENRISYTADINIAKAIKEAVINAIKIAKGQIKIGDLVKMFKSEKIDLKKSSWPMDYRYFKTKKNPDNRGEVFNLYRNYLIRSNSHYDPLFFGVTVDNFVNLNVNNVGIIASKVDMTKDIKYLESMEEFRVPIDAIQQSWRIG